MTEIFIYIDSKKHYNEQVLRLLHFYLLETHLYSLKNKYEFFKVTVKFLISVIERKIKDETYIYFIKEMNVGG